MRLLQTSCLLVAVLYHQVTYAQQPQPIFRHYTVDDGLPSSEVYYVMQDAKGYIWFATDRGVSRFNGYEFENFSTEDGLSDNTVFGIHPDHKNRLWFRTFSGKLSYFDKDSIYSLPINDELQEKIGSKINISLHVDQSDTVWMGFTLGGGICKIAPDNSFVFSLGGSLEERVNYVKQIDKHGFIFGHMGAKPVKEEKINVTTLRNSFSISISNKSKSFSHQYCIKLKNGSFIYGLYGEIICFDDSSLISRTFTDENIISLYEDREENIWVGLFRGGVLFYPKGNFLNTLPVNYLKDLSISSICEDEEGALWFTTLENGVYYLASKEYQTYTIENGLADNKVTCITGDASDGIWAGMYNGTLNYINNNNIQTYNLNESDGFGNSINCLLNNSSGNIWIGTVHGTYTVNTLTNNKELSPRLLPGAKSFYESRDDRVWVGTPSALLKYENNDRVYDSRIQEFTSRVSAIYEDDKGTVWLASIDGLWSYDGNTFENHGNSNELLKNRITDIKGAEDGLMWLATRGAGVLIKNGDDINQINTKEGLLSNMCNSLFIDEGNNAWVSTNNGLSKITIENNEYGIENYTTTDGLISNEVNQVYRQADKVWVATNKGITVFDAGKVQANTTPPPVYITGLRINDNDAILQSHYDLPYDQNHLIINYTGLSYKNAGNLQYKYKMEGVDSNWIYTTNTKIQYTTLPHGSYEFTVSAINEDGVWSDQPATVNFFIAPPFWKTWWFITLAFTIMVLAIGLIFHIRYKILSKQAYLLNKVSESEQKALRAQINPHFIFNAFNSIQKFFISNDHENAHGYLSKLTTLMRSVLDNSEESYIPIEEELNAIKLYLEIEQLRVNKFDFEIQVDDAIDTYNTFMPSMLIQPYVENAIWHGIMNKESKGKITLTLKKDVNKITFTVEDDGIGRKKAQEIKNKHKKLHKSAGLRLVSERIEALNALRKTKLVLNIIDLSQNGKACGTRVELIIPLES